MKTHQASSSSSVDYYCLMFLRDAIHARRQFKDIGSYLQARGVPYKKGDATFSAVETLWDDYYEAEDKSKEEPKKDRPVTSVHRKKKGSDVEGFSGKDVQGYSK